MNIAAALADSHLLGASIGPLDTWKSWLAVLKAAFGSPLSASEDAFFKSVAADRAPPQSPVSELWCIYAAGAAESLVSQPLWPSTPRSLRNTSSHQAKPAIFSV